MAPPNSQKLTAWLHRRFPQLSDETLQDVVQQALIEAWEKGLSDDTTSTLATIVLRRGIDVLRRKKARNQLDAAKAEAVIDQAAMSTGKVGPTRRSAERMPAVEALLRVVLSVLDELDPPTAAPRQRSFQYFRAHYIDGLTVSEAAEFFGVEVASIYDGLARARYQIVRNMDDPRALLDLADLTPSAKVIKIIEEEKP